MNSRLPIFHDDKNFRERSDQMFRDMQLQMDHDFMRGFGRPTRTWHQPQSSTITTPPAWFGTTSNPMDREFFNLRPLHSPFPSTTLDSQVGMMPGIIPAGQTEVLDQKTVNNLFLEDPENKSRLFQMSFDVKDYEPQAIQVKVEDRCLVVEAKQSEVKEGGAKVAREFCRKIQLPPEVDPEKLSSTLSSDGVLSVKAPVPPRYQNFQSISGNSSSVSPQIITQPQQQPFPTINNSNNTFTTTFRSSPTVFPQQQQQQQQQQQRVPFTNASIITPDFQPPPFPPFPTMTLPHPPLSQPIITSPMSTLNPSNQVGTTNFTVPVLNADVSTRDRPIFTILADGSRKRMDLLIDLGRQYGADNVVVRFDDRTKQLTIEATREERDQSGKTSRSQTQKQYELAENIDPSTIQAIMKQDGLLHITALTSLR